MAWDLRLDEIYLTHSSLVSSLPGAEWEPTLGFLPASAALCSITPTLRNEQSTSASYIPEPKYKPTLCVGIFIPEVKMWEAGWIVSDLVESSSQPLRS